MERTALNKSPIAEDASGGHTWAKPEIVLSQRYIYIDLIVKRGRVLKEM
jgi:hypothetical protein